MTRRLLAICLFLLATGAVLSASPITLYFTGTCTDTNCIGRGANGTVNATLVFNSEMFYDNINNSNSPYNLAYQLDFDTSTITSFSYGGSNLVAPFTISGSVLNSVFVNMENTGIGGNIIPGPLNISLTWGNPSGISYSFNTIHNSISSDGTWDYSRVNNGTRCCSQDQGINGSWSYNAPPPSSVPEPATWTLLAGGVGLLGVLGLAGKLR